MKRTTGLIVFFFSLMCREASAHGFVIHVSTPITPPAGLVWLVPVSLAAVALSVLLAFRILRLATWLESVLVSVSAALVFGLAFVFVGTIGASCFIGPLPALGPPLGVYWRFRTGWLESLFVIWNGIGVGVLLGVVFLVGRLWLPARREVRRKTLAFPVATYLLLLVPFLLTGSLAHGWAGGYVMMAGEQQLLDINRACLRYAMEHGGKLPVASTVDDLLPQIERYLKQPKPRDGNPIQVHPAAWAFEKDPKPFVWKAQLSGQKAPKLPIADEEKMPVTCPYTGCPMLFDLQDRRF